MADKLKAFEFETEESEKHRKNAEELVREVNDLIMDMDQNTRVMAERLACNGSRIARIRREQNLIKDMRCLP